MSELIDVIELTQRRGLEGATSSVADQLAQLDASGCGIGFVMVLVDVDISGDNVGLAQLTTVMSLPVVKVSGRWITTTDEAMADMLSGAIRCLARDARESNLDQSSAQATSKLISATQLAQPTVEQQLAQLDVAGCGIGFITVSTNQSETTLPTIRIRGQWVVPADEARADVFAGIIRFLVRGVES